jgi:hypothetical protein
VSLSAVGCTTIGTLQRANTVGKGAIQLAAEPLLWGYAGKSSSLVQPSIGVAGRYGVTDAIDVGVHVSSGGFEAMGKFQLTPPSAPVVVSLAPAVGGFGFIGNIGSLATNLSASGWINAQLPVLIGIPIGTSQVILAPKIQEFVLFGTNAASAVGLTSAGLSVGYAFHITDSIQLLPEVAMAYPFLGTLGTPSTNTKASPLRPNGVLYQVAIGVLFGGK